MGNDDYMRQNLWIQTFQRSYDRQGSIDVAVEHANQTLAAFDAALNKAV